MPAQLTRRACLAALAGVPGSESILVHEHVLVDFGGTGRYDPDEVFRLALPKLEELRGCGCRRMLECTPNYLGRNPRLLQRLAGATGIEIWTNTGLYGAAGHKYLPAFARSETHEQLARRWIEEARHGMDGVKPRFIKIGVNRAPLDELDRKLVRAAALASGETGLTVASHTGDGAAALEQIEIFAAARVPSKRFVWVHAHNEKDHSFHRRAAQAGAWVEFDGISPQSAAWHRECVEFMAGQKLLERTLLSHDAGWYHVGEPGGGAWRGYTSLYSDLLPTLNRAWVRPLVIENPAAAFGR